MAVGDTAALLRSIRRHTHIPDTHPSYSDAFVLEDATEELHSYLLPLGLAERQELWAGPPGRIRFPLEEGVSTYDIPHRAVGGKLRAVRLLSPQSDPVYLQYYGREEVAHWQDVPGTPTGLVVEGATFRLWPTPRALPGYMVEVDTYLRPAALVPTNSVGLVSTAGVPSGGSVTVTALRTADNDDVFIAEWLDVVKSTPPFETVAVQVAVISVTLVAGTLWEFVLDTPEQVQALDYLCMPGTAPVVQAPLEWHPLLALKVAARHLASLGDLQAAQAKGGEGQQKQSQAATLIRPRREDVTKKPRNGMDKWKTGGGWGY